MFTLEDFDNIEVTMENEYIFQDLLYSRYGDPSNPNTKLYDGDDKYWTNIPVCEKVFPLRADPKMYEIWECNYPFRNFKDTYKGRPCLIWPIDNELRAIKLSSFDKKKPSKVKLSKMPWVRFLKDWNGTAENLSRNTMIIGNSRVKLNNVEFLHKRGMITEPDKFRVQAALKEFNFRRFNTVYNFKEWLLNNYVSDTIAHDGSNNNNHNPTQTLQDIAKSKKANCVDIANAVHRICYKNRNQKHWIIIARFYIMDPRHWNGHVYTIIERTDGTKIVLDYYRDKDDPHGEIREYSNTELTDVINEENSRLKPAMDKLFGGDTRSATRIIDAREFQIWDSYVNQKRNQESLLDRFSHMHI